MGAEELTYTTAGPFMIEVSGPTYFAHYRVWLTRDASRKVVYEGTARELEEFFRELADKVGE